ncbi:dual-action HEIGH metallo-peptidase [Chitinophaga polysaccharea]|uniref:Dual-action HEIGH metallo-peptidase n=1 Tax=Chitinophaga polysaccharea TaxID=1293035 RepID=A0A561Q2X8_9BACT|nr:M57 family metalloprotease [Chitinophaga polysaccharea]TWF44721.1 dual-action HEIGH metallo-peptidase [Chitinophaga polysaccharea]
MNSRTKFLACAAAGAVFLSACVKTPTNPEDDKKISPSTVSKINALGFDTLNAKKLNGGYVVEGDLFLTEKDLESKQGYTVLSIAEADQYKLSYTLTALPRTINVSVAGLPAAYSNAADIAIARFNALSLSITFKKVANTSDADIEIKDGKLGDGTQALTPAYPAVARNPSSPITLDVTALGTSLDEKKLATLIAHEIAHAIGLRHTTYADNLYHCTYKQIAKTSDTQADLIKIDGTPTSGAGFSWMSGCLNNEDHPFNPNDVIALNYFYNNLTGIFNVPTATYRKGTKELHLFVRSKNNTLLEKVYTPVAGWSAWTDLGGTLTSDPSVTSRDENNIAVFARGANNNLIFKTWTLNGGWSQQWTDLGGTFYSAPNAASRGANFINVLVKGANNVLQTRYYVEGEGWHEWQSFATTVASSATSASRYVNSIEMYAQDASNHLLQGVWTRESDRTVWQSLGGTIYSAPAAIARGNFNVDVFALGNNHQLITTNWYVDNNWKSWQPIGSSIYSAPAVASSDSLSMDIFVKGPSDNLIQRTWTKANGYGPWISL